MPNERRDLGYFIFLLALVLRLGWVAYRSISGSAAYPDETLHWNLAVNLVNDGTLAVEEHGLVKHAPRMPLYPLFLAIFAWLGDTGMILARLTQALAGAATAWLVYRFGNRAIHPTVGLVAGVLVAVDPFLVFFSALLLTEVVFTLVGVALVYSAWLGLQRSVETRLAGLISVVLLGPVAIMTRPSAAGWIVLLWLVLFWLLRDRWWRVSFAVAAPLVLALIMLPWGIRNYLVIGDFAWLSANGGVTLYDAQGPQATGASDQGFLQEMPELQGMGEVERDEYLAAQAWEQMRSDPLRVVQLAGVKLLRTWSLRPNVEQYRGGPVAWISILFMLGVLIAAAIGTFQSLYWRTLRRRRARLLTLLWLPIVYFTLLHMIYIGSVRYRLPVMPMVEMTAALAFVRQQRERSERVQRLFAASKP